MRALRLVLVPALVVAACAGGGDPAADPPEPRGSLDGTAPLGDTVAVVEVFDGDSLLVATPDGEREVRLAGVNAPERDECAGAAAGAWLAAAAGDEVTLVVVGGADDTDQFDRLLRDVWTGGRWLNLEAVTAGHAMALHTGRDRQDELLAAGEAAWEDRLGMWAGEACGPGEDGVAIADVIADPPGPDQDATPGELVTITNRGDGPVTIGGWVLRDESTRHRFVFPPGTTLDPGASLTVVSGCGHDEPAVLSWCAAGPVWSNGGDTALLLTADGTVVDRLAYP